MWKLTLTRFMTLYGVVRSPGGPDEDPSGGFAKGGLAGPAGELAFGPVNAPRSP
jgi:hypothetical protein